MCEFVPGGDLASALAADNWPTYDEVRAFAVGLLAGVAAMHSTETVHRDIKPENIALRGGDWSQPVLLDLGLSKMLDVDSLTTYPALFGTRPFMAPEQIRLQEARKGADVWAVGVILHLLLTKKHPFYGPKAAKVHIDEAVKLVSSGAADLPGDVPEPLRTVATRLLNAVPNQRGSAQRALSDLTNPDRIGEGTR
jgi:serine/threonine protein kinase